MTADPHTHLVPEPPPGPLADLQRAYGRGMLAWADAIDSVKERMQITAAAAEELVADWDSGGWDY